MTAGALSVAGVHHHSPRGGSMIELPKGGAHKSGVASPRRIADLTTVGVPGQRAEAL